MKYTRKQLKKRLDNAIQIQKQEIEHPGSGDTIEHEHYQKGFLTALEQVRAMLE